MNLHFNNPGHGNFPDPERVHDHDAAAESACGREAAATELPGGRISTDH